MEEIDIDTQLKEESERSSTHHPQKCPKTSKKTRPQTPTAKKEAHTSTTVNGSSKSATSPAASGTTSKTPLKVESKRVPPSRHDQLKEQEYSAYLKENIELRKQRKDLEDETFKQRNEIQKLRNTLTDRSDSKLYLKAMMQEIVREEITTKFTTLIGTCLQIETQGQDCSGEVLLLKNQIGLLENKLAVITDQIGSIKEDVNHLKELIGSLKQVVGQCDQRSCQGPAACSVIERVLNGFLANITKTLESGNRKRDTDYINSSDEDTSLSFHSNHPESDAGDYYDNLHGDRKRHCKSRLSTEWGHSEVESSSRARNNNHVNRELEGKIQTNIEPKPGDDLSEVQSLVNPRRSGLRPRVNQNSPYRTCDSSVSTLVPPPPRSFHGYRRPLTFASSSDLLVTPPKQISDRMTPSNERKTRSRTFHKRNSQ